jgi:hypothetical protein
MFRNCLASAKSHLAFCALVFTTTLAIAQDESNASISVGALREKAEASVVRVLVKFGDSLSVSDRLVPKSISGHRADFYTLNRVAKIDATDKGA